MFTKLFSFSTKNTLCIILLVMIISDYLWLAGVNTCSLKTGFGTRLDYTASGPCSQYTRRWLLTLCQSLLVTGARGHQDGEEKGKQQNGTPATKLTERKKKKKTLKIQLHSSSVLLWISTSKAKQCRSPSKIPVVQWGWRTAHTLLRNIFLSF